MQDPDEAENNLMLAEARPSLLLRGERPRLIDEWQDAPQLWDAVRFSVDREQLETGDTTEHLEPPRAATATQS